MKIYEVSYQIQTYPGRVKILADDEAHAAATVENGLRMAYSYRVHADRLYGPNEDPVIIINSVSELSVKDSGDEGK